MHLPRRTALLVSLLAAALPATAQDAPPAPAPAPPAVSEHVTVTATRIPEDAAEVPASITVVSGEELRDLGATDLRGALALAAGVDVVPGGDGGPAGAVPEIWGLREFDAFLLVVDGVPWGGPFAPDLATVNLADVERIELLRGSAPVMYGATSFSGVIQVVRRAAGAGHGSASARLGTHGSGAGSLSLELPSIDGWSSSLSLDGGRQGFDDPRTDWARGHALWRNRKASGKGLWRFDVDASLVDQSPASPRPREGKTLSPSVPVDANHNPDGAFLDRRRYSLAAGYDRRRAGGIWSTTLSYARSTSDALRGFLADLGSPQADAAGFRQQIGVNELYFDTHLEWTRSSVLRAVAGLDFLHGNGESEGFAFDYETPLDGSSATPPPSVPPGDDVRSGDRRDFFGAYAFAEWNPSPRWRVEGGLRLNVTNEARDEGEEETAPKGPEPSRTDTRPSGSAALSWTAWSRGRNLVRLFTGYRNTFKPAVFDFGLGEAEGEGEAGLLEPETAQSVELGARSRLLEGRLALELAAFLMDFENLVVSTSVNGLPALQNAGSERFKGIETSLAWRVRPGLSVRGGYSFHDSRFRDFVTEFDGVPTQLGGKRFEMVPRHLATGAIVLAPETGPLAVVSVRYVGDRYLNKRNTALAEPYTDWSAALGWRTRRIEVRLDGRNLGDVRPPVAESEIGDAQYYLLPGRQVDLSVSLRF
jgi:iron complex outermembrane receptor protein